MRTVRNLLDSYRHYRQHVACGRLRAVYRALYYELRGREPWA